MLKQIRQNTKLILWTLLAFIVPPFIFFGIESAFVKKDDPIIAKIFHKKIRLSEKLRERRITMNMLRLNYPSQWQQFDIENTTWRRILSETFAQHLGLKVSDKELSDTIIKRFSVNDRFDKTLYLKIVNEIGMSIKDFEKAVRHSLLAQKLQKNIFSTVILPESEIQKHYIYENEQLIFLYTTIEYEPFIKDQKVDPSEIESYYQEHIENFRVGAQRQYQYIKISFEKTFQETSIEQEDIETYYEEHKETFTDEEGNVTPFTDVKEMIEQQLREKSAKVSLQKKVYILYDKILEGASLDVLSRDHKLKLQQSPFLSLNDEYLKWQINQRTWKEINLSPIHEILEPFFIEKDIFIIQAIQQRASHIPPLSKVEEDIREALIKKNAYNAAQKYAKAQRKKIIKLMDDDLLGFQKSCEQLGLEAQQFPPFARIDSVIGISPLKTAAWSLKIREVSNILPIQNGFTFGSVQERIKPKQDDIDAEIERYRDIQLNKHKEALMTDLLQWLQHKSEIYKENTQPATS